MIFYEKIIINKMKDKYCNFISNSEYTACITSLNKVILSDSYSLHSIQHSNKEIKDLTFENIGNISALSLHVINHTLFILTDDMYVIILSKHGDVIFPADILDILNEVTTILVNDSSFIFLKIDATLGIVSISSSIIYLTVISDVINVFACYDHIIYLTNENKLVYFSYLSRSEEEYYLKSILIQLEFANQDILKFNLTIVELALSDYFLYMISSDNTLRSYDDCAHTKVIENVVSAHLLSIYLVYQVGWVLYYVLPNDEKLSTNSKLVNLMNLVNMNEKILYTHSDYINITVVCMQSITENYNVYTYVYSENKIYVYTTKPIHKILTHDYFMNEMGCVVSNSCSKYDLNEKFENESLREYANATYI